jgi:hypothetical protein
MRIDHHHQKGMSVTPTEPTPKSASTSKSGFFAALCGLLRVNGSGAPSGTSAVSRVSQQAVAGKTLTNPRSSRRLLRSMTLAPLLVFVSALAFTAAPALADTAPAVTIKAASGLTATTANVSGTINPNGGPSETTWGFQYSKEPVTEGWTPAGGITVSGSYLENSAEATSVTPLNVAGTIEGLQPNVAYKVRLVATNAGGEASPEPEVTAKTAPVPPALANESSSAVTQTGATLNVGINPNNQETSYVFEYGVGVAGQIPLVIPAPVVVNGASALTGFVEQPASVSTGVLAPRTTYDYRAVATNEKAEKTEGPVQEFTTLATPLATTAAVFCADPCRKVSAAPASSGRAKRNPCPPSHCSPSRRSSSSRCSMPSAIVSIDRA